MGIVEGEGVPIHELRGFAAWKAQIRRILVNNDEDVNATKHKYNERVENLQILAEKVSKATYNRRKASVTKKGSTF